MSILVSKQTSSQNKSRQPECKLLDEGVGRWGEVCDGVCGVGEEKGFEIIEDEHTEDYKCVPGVHHFAYLHAPFIW